MSVVIQTEPFDPASALAAFTARQNGEPGAIVTFSGHVRGEGGLTALELESYDGLTEREIARMETEARTGWPLLDVMIIHRYGPMAPGEAIVFVAAAAKHRRSAFEAADFLMDGLKTRAPFWKKEITETGARWIEPRAEDYVDASRWATAAPKQETSP
ncbi:MAG: molybdenum cofactor biosynthesis protein MoaE [Pseudomonadota bacterium]